MGNCIGTHIDMFSGTECSNCSGCLYENSCLGYDTTGQSGPINTTQCSQAGGIDCSGILGSELHKLLYLIVFCSSRRKIKCY